MTHPGRDPRSDAPRTSWRGIRQGSVSGAELRGSGYRARTGGAMWRGVIFLVIFAVIVVAGGALIIGPGFRDFAAGLARDNPQALRFPFVGDVIKDQLGDKLTRPAGSDPSTVSFVVSAGESVTQVANALTAAKLISEPMVFQYLVVTQNLDGKLQTGTFRLNQTMTPQQIVDRLQQTPDPPVSKTTVALREGLRIEQITAYLQTLPLEMNVQLFYDEAQKPPANLATDYPFLKTIPKGKSLEGFLGAGVFEVDTNITPDELVRTLLNDWARDIGQGVIDQAQKKGKDPYHVMTLASIVERETAIDSERVKIAGVYTNRLSVSLNPTGLMNAEPTVIYANDTMKLRDIAFDQWQKYSFWGLTGFADLNQLKVSPDLEPYQSWHTPGLPPTPIDSPALSSINAALSPDTKGGYLYFYACPGQKTHKFARTLAEQSRNIASCKK